MVMAPDAGASEMETPQLTQQSRTYAAVLVALVRTGVLAADDDATWRALRSVSRHWRAVLDGVLDARQTLVVTHAECARHRIPRRAEKPERLRYVMDRLLQRLPRLTVDESFAPATIQQLTRFHSEVHVYSLHKLAAKIERSMAALDELEKRDGFVSPRASSKQNGFHNPDDAPYSPSSSYYRKRPDMPKSKATYYSQFEYIDLDEDTILMRHTLDAALLAAGGVCHAVNRVLSSPLEPSTRPPRNAFCVIRPPGHHAEPQRSMGFCFFNNIGVAAFHALDKFALDRVAIIDFDVHHGNGTQKRAESEPRLLYVSLHQSPLYPHSGFAREKGPHDNIVNIPLPARSSGAVYRRKFVEVVWPRVAAFRPQLVLISAGFDGHANDPLSDMKLQASDFYWMTSEIVRMAWHWCRGRVVSVLEGGYNSKALADSAEQHVLALVHGSVEHAHAAVHHPCTQTNGSR